MKLIPLILIAAVLARAQSAPPGGRDFTGLVNLQQPTPSSFDCSADGTVVNSVTSEPIARARVNVMSGGTTYAATTDSSADGHFPTWAAQRGSSRSLALDF
jgi:hypothetical protein